MIFAQVDLVTGEILGLETQYYMPGDDNWINMSVEAYQLVCLNNGQYIVDIKKVAEYANSFKELTNDIPLILPEHLMITKSIDKAKQAKKHKNEMYKNLFIEGGVKFGEYNFPFKLEDRIIYLENHSFKHPKVSVYNSDNELVELDKSDFEELYFSQLKNKKYYEVYTIQLNKFIDTFEDYDELQKINYEYDLPDEYSQVIKEEMDKFDIKSIKDLDFTVNDESEVFEITEEIENIDTTNKIIENLKDNLEHPEKVEHKKVPRNVKKQIKKENRKR
jgi:hypothetical protein